MRPTLLAASIWVLAFVLQTRGDDTSPAATTAAPAPAAKLVVELSDSSLIIGTPSLEKLTIAAKYATLQMPLESLKSLEFNGEDHTARLNLRNGDHVSGQLTATEITLKTIFGDATIPLSKVKKIRVKHAESALPEGLVLHYTFDDDENGNVTDSSENGNDATVRGATYSDDGKSGKAMNFTADRQGAVVKNPANLQMQDFTLMAWVKRGSQEKVSRSWVDGVIFSCGQNGYGIGLHEDGSIYLSNIGSNAVFSSCKINDGQYHHVAVTKKGNEVVFYLDGEAFPADNLNTNFEFGAGVGVGARPDNLTATFIGLIDEVAVFNRPLSADEVKAVFSSQK